MFQMEEAETEPERRTMALFVIRREEDPLQPSHETGIVIKGVEDLNDKPLVAHACAVLSGLIYALHWSYPSELKYTFDALRKIFLETKGNDTQSVHSEC